MSNNHNNNADNNSDNNNNDKNKNNSFYFLFTSVITMVLRCIKRISIVTLGYIYIKLSLRHPLIDVVEQTKSTFL